LGGEQGKEAREGIEGRGTGRGRKAKGDLQESERHDSEEGDLDTFTDLDFPEHRDKKEGETEIGNNVDS
jgi:hypothetical protein